MPLLPVIFLTSRDDEEAEVTGFSLGADDYIKKPFSQKLLLERIKAVLRRRAVSIVGDDAADQKNILQRGRLRLDDARHLATWDNKPVDMTVTEYLVLKSLALNPGHVLTRDKILDFAYGETIYADDRTIDSHIKRIRRKFKDVDASFDQIETSYGLGYAFKGGGG